LSALKGSGPFPFGDGSWHIPPFPIVEARLLAETAWFPSKAKYYRSADYSMLSHAWSPPRKAGALSVPTRGYEWPQTHSGRSRLAWDSRVWRRHGDDRWN